MVIKSQIAKIEIFLLVNVALLIILYSIPIKDNNFLENLCIYKLISKKECFNCGMTRAFLSIIHGNFDMAITYNRNSILVFPFTIIAYLYSWYKFIWKKKMIYLVVSIVYKKDALSLCESYLKQWKNTAD